MGKHASMRIFQESSDLILHSAKEKILGVKNDRQLAALLFLEFMLTLIIIAAIYLFLDARVEILQPPLNIFVFVGVVYAVFHLYNYTEYFRSMRRNSIRREKTFRTLILELVIFAIIVISALIYNNQEINIAPYPFNFIIFLAVLAVPLYFYVSEKFLSA